MKNLRMAIVALLGGLTGYCAATAPAFAAPSTVAYLCTEVPSYSLHPSAEYVGQAILPGERA